MGTYVEVTMLMADVLLKRSRFRGSVNRCRKTFPLAPKIRTSPKNASQTGHYGALARVCSRRWRVRLFNAFRRKLIIGFVCCQASFFRPVRRWNVLSPAFHEPLGQHYTNDPKKLGGRFRSRVTVSFPFACPSVFFHSLAGLC